MKKQYAIQWNDIKGRDSIRKWAGKTRGASILRSEKIWYKKDAEDSWSTEWSNIYIIEIKNSRTEMLIKLQFPSCFLFCMTQGGIVIPV